MDTTVKIRPTGHLRIIYKSKGRLSDFLWGRRKVLQYAALDQENRTHWYDIPEHKECQKCKGQYELMMNCPACGRSGIVSNDSEDIL